MTFYKEAQGGKTFTSGETIKYSQIAAEKKTWQTT